MIIVWPRSGRYVQGAGNGKRRYYGSPLSSNSFPSRGFEQSAAGTEGSNPPLSAKQSVLFTYYLEIPANPSVTRRFCAQCEPEKAVSLQIR